MGCEIPYFIKIIKPADCGFQLVRSLGLALFEGDTKQLLVQLLRLPFNMYGHGIGGGRYLRGVVNI